ncbi:hypothetical protein HK102_003118 [Quaeritorhiza haematococci]|nr:hypothetical protein HK102_003118 [Quaeritorhiza haematococci]
MDEQICAAGVFLMAPASGYFYSGTVEFKSAMSLLILAFAIYATVSIQWYLFGYSLAFEGEGPVIGNFSNAAILKAFDGVPHPHYPLVNPLVFILNQNMFACVAPALAYGAVSERIRIFPFIVFIFLWTTLVYDPTAYWSWAPNGWLRKLGYLDFAGGGPVHTTAGFSGLALCLILRKRENPNSTPHSLPLMTLGTVLFWFGWMFFNGGSEGAFNPRAVLAMINTNLAASFGGLAWLFFDWRIHQKFTSLGFCTGAISGMVCVTPGAGWIMPHYAIIYGVVGAVLANLSCFAKGRLGYDDTMDVFPVHGVAGGIGSILTGIFASGKIFPAGTVGEVNGGILDGNPTIFGIQVLGVVAIGVWSFLVTAALAKIMEYIPGLGLRVSREEEEIGCDITLCGEVAYDYTNTSTQYMTNGTSTIKP